MLGANRGKGKVGGGILEGIFGGSAGQKQQVQALAKQLRSTAVACGAVFKKQKILYAMVEAIAQELDIELDLQDIAVDIGDEEIAYFENMIKELGDDGTEDVGVLTKINAMRKLLSLFQKMSKNVGAAAKACQRTENTVNEIERHLREKEIKKEDSP